MRPEAVSVRPTGAVACLNAEAQRQLEDGPRHLHRHEAPRHQHDLCAMNYDFPNQAACPTKERLGSSTISMPSSTAATMRPFSFRWR